MRGGKLEVRPQFVLRRSTLLHDRRRSSPAGHAAPGVPRERFPSSSLPVPGLPPAQRAHDADLSWGRNVLCRRERFPSSPRPAPGIPPAPQGHDRPVVGADFLRRRERFLSSPLPAPGHPPAQLGHGVCTAEGAHSIKKIRKRDERGTLRSSRVGETGCATRRPPTASDDTNRGATHFSRPIAGAKVSKAGVPVSRNACTRAEKPASGGTPRRWVRACGSGPRPPRG